MRKLCKLAFRLGFFAWLVILLRLTVFRDGCFSNGWFSGEVVWVPFRFLAKLIRIRYWSYFLYLFLGNIFWFAPLGFAVRVWKGSFWKALLFGFLLSAFIETAQFVLGSGVTEVEDLILNTSGACLGWLLAASLRRITAHRS